MNIDELVDVIKAKQLAIVPTDTVYGIIGDALDEGVIHKVYEAKKREYSKPLILMVSDINMLNKYVLEINDLEQRLIDKFWPGKLTILFKKNKLISDLITSGSDLVGIRLPDNKELVELIIKLDKPLISTSCNISTRDVITSINLVEKELLDKISFVYDCGEMSDVSSTIVQVVDDKIKILREGELVSLIKEEFRGELL